jgi:hypothetical protein
MKLRTLILNLTFALAACGDTESKDPESDAGATGDAASGVGTSDAGPARTNEGPPGADGGTEGANPGGHADAGPGNQSDAAMRAEDANGIDAGGTRAADGGSASDAARDAASDAMPNRDAGDATGNAQSTFHVFLLLGQSNMAGYPKAQAADKVKEPRIRVLGYDNCTATGRRKDAWDTAVPPLHECGVGAIGPGDYFAKTLLSLIPAGDTIGLVPCAISGEKIETFLKSGGAKYGWIVERAKQAQQASGKIEGFLFHQGESNCGDGAWPGKVKTLVTDLRTDLGLGEVPFLAGELVPNGACASHNTLVGQLPGLITNAHVVSAQGLVLDVADTQWRLHFDHDSQVTFGKRYAATLKDALHW